MIELFEKVSLSLKDFYKSYNFNLHCGGCGLAALFIHRKFLMLGINTKIKILDEQKPNYPSDIIEQEIEKYNIVDLYEEYDINLAHIVNEYGDYYIDMNSFMKKEEFLFENNLVEVITINSNRLKKMINHKPNWNPTYNRQYTKKVKHDIETAFASINI